MSVLGKGLGYTYMSAPMIRHLGLKISACVSVPVPVPLTATQDSGYKVVLAGKFIGNVSSKFYASDGVEISSNYNAKIYKY